MKFEYPRPIDFADFAHPPLSTEDQVLPERHVQRSKRGAKNASTLDRAQCGILELYLENAQSKRSKSFTRAEGKPAHKTLGSSRKDRFYFVPANPSPDLLPQPDDIATGSDPVAICWRLSNPKRIHSAKIEIFRPNHPAPIAVIKLAWKNGRLRPVDGVADEENDETGKRQESDCLKWNGALTPADDNARDLFPTGCVTAAFSPYKIRMDVQPQGGTECTCATAWTYFDVLVEKIELVWGDEKVIARDRQDIGLETVVGSNRDDLVPISTDQWLDKALQNTKVILGELKQGTTNAGSFETDQEIPLHSPTCITEFAQTKTDAMFRAYRNMWGEGPLIPIFARVRLLDSTNQSVDAPWALAKADFLWDWEDDDQPSKKAEVWTDKEQKRTKEYLKKALNFLVADEAVLGYAPEGSNNCHRLHGGKRGRGAAPIFPPQTPDITTYKPDTVALADHLFPFAVRPAENRKWAVLSQARTSGVLAGRTGVLFQPSRMAGDTYRLSVYLAIPGFQFQAKGVDLRKDKKMQLPKASTGRFVVWRKMPLKVIKKDPHSELNVDVAEIQRIYAAAGVRLNSPPPLLIQAMDWETAFAEGNKLLALSKGKFITMDKYQLVYHALAPSQGNGPYILEIKAESKLDALYDDTLPNGLCRLRLDIPKTFNYQGRTPFSLNCMDHLQHQVTHRRAQVIHVFNRTDTSVEAVVQAPLGWCKVDDAVLVDWSNVVGQVKSVQVLKKDDLRLLNGQPDSIDNDIWGLAKALAGLMQRAYLEAKFPNDESLFLFLFKDAFARRSSGGPSEGAAYSGEQKEMRGLAYTTYNPEIARASKVKAKSVTAVCAHELAHSLYLAHLAGGGATEPQPRLHIAVESGTKEEDIDHCLMNYHPKSERFCGLCILRLRGWACHGPEDATNAAELVPLLSEAQENEGKKLVVDSITVEIPPTPPRTKRKLPGSDNFNVPRRLSRQITARSPKLSNNPPLVLMSDSVDASVPKDPDPQIQAVGAPITLVANYHESPFALDGDVVWKVERYGGEGKDGPQVEAESSNALPTLTPDPNDSVRVTLQTDAVGTFTIFAAYDRSGTGNFGDTEKQEAVCLNVVLIKVKFLQNAHQFSADLNWTGHRWTGKKENDFLITLREKENDPAPLVLKSEVHLIGGGPKGMLGLDKTRAGWINNISQENTGARYKNDSGNDAWELRTVPIHRPSAKVPYTMIAPQPSVNAPLVDKGGGATITDWHAGSGVLSEVSPKTTDALTNAGTPANVGHKCWIEAKDAPEQGWDLTPPVKKDDPAHYRLQNLWLTVDFQAHLCFWTNDAPDLVGVIERVDWKIDGEYDVSDALGATAIRDLTVTRSNDQHFSTLVPGLTTDVELWPPTGKSVYMPRNIDPTINDPVGTSFKEGKA